MERLPINPYKERFGKERVLIIDLEDERADFSVSRAKVIKQEGNRQWLQFNRDVMSASQLISRISESYEIKDLSIKDPEIEVMIRNIYESGLNEVLEAPKP